MKIRDGFVSNSSSSSFIVIVKSAQPATSSSLLKAMEVPCSSPLYGAAKNLVGQFLGNQINGPFEEYIEEQGYCSEDEFKFIKQALANKFPVFTVHVDNDNEFLKEVLESFNGALFTVVRQY